MGDIRLTRVNAIQSTLQRLPRVFMKSDIFSDVVGKTFGCSSLTLETLNDRVVMS